jgi:hypothetical protein
MRAVLRFALSLVCSAACASGALAQVAKNLLFFGNSYSARNGGVGDLVRLLAIEAGLPAPTIVKRYVSSADLLYHATNSAQVAAINSSLPAGQRWDFVVMQGQSLEATAAMGDPVQFRAAALQILGNVRNHSPQAKAVLYQTWARAVGHFLYPGTFASPRVLHDEIRANYLLARSDLDAAYGAGAARNAAVGDGVALLGWQPSYYDPDLFHPLPPMTLLAGMCLFTSIYGVRVCPLEPNFAGNSALVTWLAGLGLGSAEWDEMAGLADLSAARSVRPFAGSGDQLTLESGVAPGNVGTCTEHDVGLGSLLTLRVRSRNGVYTNAPAMMLVDVFPNGLPPPPSPLWPELVIDVGGMLVLLQSPTLQQPLGLTLPLPFSFPGASVLVQGIAFAPSSATGNPQLTTTEGCVLVFQ